MHSMELLSIPDVAACPAEEPPALDAIMNLGLQDIHPRAWADYKHALDRLIDTARRVEVIIGRPLPGQVMKAGTSDRRYPLPERVIERLAAR